MRLVAISYQPIEVISDLDEGWEILLGQLAQDVFEDQGGFLCNLAGKIFSSSYIRMMTEDR